MYQGDQKQRRKEQNRAAQRAFRERKERYVKELQSKIKEMEKKHNEEMTKMTQENESLKSLVKKMEAEIYTLKGAAMAFNLSISKLREAGLDVPSPTGSTSSSPQSDRPSPPAANMLDNSLNRNAIMTTIRDKDGFSTNEKKHSFGNMNTIHNSVHHYNQHHSSVVFQHASNENTDDDLTLGDDEEASFAERETKRFEHHVDPIMHTGITMIPCSQIWERLSRHPNFDEFDLDQLCEELKKKAKCSGHGPVIPESELLEVLHRMDNRII
ncbi:uncharacterized protein BX663DRAFT_143330 [Cokeromyces recurvatus]|uniref:uncharacterized protein n=1 Tax=Cokeromyces recurvatus TaxID=90255 RepID=UPI00221EF5FE|nr:uncharacterized protein BX663DRAFT_143330 [Cokeromyces recurvatus]KAI7901037.1 hypothetical protein BX663DRAFT_143330 [Cokeromyces recurvatus]